MLTVQKIPAGTAAGYADYLEGKTVASELGDYYLVGGERVDAPGRWVAGANVLGRDPEAAVGGKVLRELMAVRHPETGEPLRDAGASGESVAALDATFSAPKSVSAVWAVADPRLRAQIEQAHETAIDRTMTYAAAQVPLARQRLDRDTVTHVRVKELVATSWRHTTSRALDGRAPDPQLHSHVLIHAGVRKDGQLVAIDSRALFTHRRELGAAYRSELARELTSLGFTIERGTGQGGRYFEIAGVPQLLRDEWSGRHHQVQQAIRQRLTRSGRHTLTPAEERLASVSTRAGKQPATRADLDREWHTTATRLKFGPSARAWMRDHKPMPVRPVNPETLGEALTEFDSTFTRSQARAVALEQTAGLRIRNALGALAEMREHGELLTLSDGRLTTYRHRQIEIDAVGSMRQLATQRVEPFAPQLIEREANVLTERLREQGGVLTDEQRRALALATSDRQLVVIEGHAGAGKSTILQAVGRVHRAAGQNLIITSTSALAAERLGAELNDAGAPNQSLSTATLDSALRAGRTNLTPATTIIHDEAALASTRELWPLLARAEVTGARLILVGDPHQNQPVGAGGLWRHLERTAVESDAHVELTGNVRALDADDRRDQALFRAGDHAAALHGYMDRGRIHLHRDHSSAEDAALEAAHSDREDGLRTLVIAQTSNEHLDELNARVQAIRLENGELGRHSLPVPGRPYAVRAGDDVQIRRTVEIPGRGWLRNGTNGTVASVSAHTGRMVLRLGEEREVALTQDQLGAADIRLAYVQHPFPAQGVTADTVHLIAGEHVTASGSYVGLTRARQRTDVYATMEVLETREARDPVQLLAEAIGVEELEAASIERNIDFTVRVPSRTVGRE